MEWLLCEDTRKTKINLFTLHIFRVFSTKKVHFYSSWITSLSREVSDSIEFLVSIFNPHLARIRSSHVFVHTRNRNRKHEDDMDTKNNPIFDIE